MHILPSWLPLQGLQAPDIDGQVVEMTQRWCAEGPDDIVVHKQSHWERLLVLNTVDALGSACDDAYHQVRFKAAIAPHTTNWLLALPVSLCGLQMEEEVMRVTVGLLLGVGICEPHACSCGPLVTADG